MSVALIVGGSAGIGQAAAEQIARRGHGVIVTYRRHPEGAEEVVNRITAHGGTAAALPLDVGETSSFNDFAGRVRDTLERTWQTRTLDALVNNAGVSGTAMLGEHTEENYERLHRVLLKGPLFLTQALAPMLADGGAIVNTTSTSTHATGTTPGYSVYAAMKGGLVVLTRYLAGELSTRGIRVNSVSPGPTRTRLADDAFEKYPELIAPLAERIALGRIGEPADVGAVIAFLISEEARWITGQDIEASGGHDL